MDEEVAELARKAEDLEEQLDELNAEQRKNLEDFSCVLNGVIKVAASPDYEAMVNVVKGALQVVFNATNEGELGGVAYETTLKVLLFDIAVMLYGAQGRARHPGFLVHDSPREAEMGQSLIDGIVEFMAELTGDEQATPFQYIITTTSDLPASMKEFTRLVLCRADEDTLLFKQRLVRPQVQQELLLK